MRFELLEKILLYALQHHLKSRRIEPVCGICGEVTFDGAAVDVTALSRMTEAMAPRGPDGMGVSAEDFAKSKSLNSRQDRNR